MSKQQIVIATRESPLAICQAQKVCDSLMAHYPDLTIKLLGITTEADKLLDVTLNEIGGKGLFVKELEQALLNGEADIAVHSMKDVPMILPKELCLPVMLKRAECRDVFISNNYKSIDQLPNTSIIGTSSLRRQTQIRALYPQIALQNLRGNINTRLNRLDHGDFDAIILAAAGILRMGFEPRITEYFSIDAMLPAAGQGALGLECRVDDDAIKSLIAPLNHAITFDSVSAERALCRRLNGGCRLPIAAYAEIKGEQLLLRGLVANHDGTEILRAVYQGHRQYADDIGEHVAQLLINQGAAKILQTFTE